jgi:hypothetical protein
MYKALCIAALLVPTFVFTQESKSISAPAGTFSSPQIVAKAKLPNQTATIPTTTIFTPAQNGLFRLSAYATIVAPALGSSSVWYYNFSWTDDSGIPQGGGNGILCACSTDAGPGAFGWNFVAGFGVTLIFEAKAGTPVTYNVTQSGPPDGSAYSLYYTLERLE